MVVTCSCVTTGTDTFAPLPLTAPELSPKPSGRSECPSHTGAAGTAVTCRAVVRPIRRPFRPRRSHSLVGPGRRPGHRGEKGRRHQSKRGRGEQGMHRGDVHRRSTGRTAAPRWSAGRVVDPRRTFPQVAGATGIEPVTLRTAGNRVPRWARLRRLEI
jgi:hypothetical protein